MRFRLEWNQGFYESNDWNLITQHPHFLTGTVFERLPFGWCAF
jgi:hypothetical protein